MECDPAYRMWCSAAEPPADEIASERLSTMQGAWTGIPRDHGVTVSVIRKVQTFLQSRQAVMHLDLLINKKDPLEVRYLMHHVLAQRMPVQVAFLQGAVPLQHDDLFPRLLDLLERCPVWSLNIGELRFSEQQCARLAEALKTSGVTHLFYECTVAGQWKDVYRGTIRANRGKHGLWRFGPDAEQNHVVLAAVKNWCVAGREPRALALARSRSRVLRPALFRSAQRSSSRRPPPSQPESRCRSLSLSNAAGIIPRRTVRTSSGRRATRSAGRAWSACSAKRAASGAAYPPRSTAGLERSIARSTAGTRASPRARSRRRCGTGTCP